MENEKQNNLTISVFFSENDRPDYEAIKKIADSEGRGFGFIVARIFREWQELKDDNV